MVGRKKSSGDLVLRLVFDGESHGDIRFCSFGRRYTVFNQTPRSKWHPPVPRGRRLQRRRHCPTLVDRRNEWYRFCSLNLFQLMRYVTVIRTRKSPIPPFLKEIRDIKIFVGTPIKWWLPRDSKAGPGKARVASRCCFVLRCPFEEFAVGACFFGARF